ncbi:MAG TPA: IPT/TIG domain-containing protein [Thermoanaerobaculia bacterium]|jgi:hypothetical protein|nr:IPT/TIG domain-containing protein [Thermoanaerobaculia bacterium]
MRRTAIALTLVALVVVGFYACSADAPTAPKPGNNGGGQGSSALTIQLFTSDANPKAGTCTLVQAVVSLNGNPVPDGTGVSFTTDFGAFSQSGVPLVSVVTQNGTAVTALCGPGAGTAKIHAAATVQGKNGSANLSVVFQPDSGTLPFVASCNPSFGAKEGGTSLQLNGGRFFGTPSTTRVTFTVNGVTRDGVVQSIAANSVTVLTPGFSEFAAPALPAAVTLILGTNLPQPVSVSLPNCFTFGTSSSGTPTISAILPSSGTTEGGTRVTIVGSGFSTQGVQVFFGTKEASVVSVNYNQIVVLSPRHLATDGGLVVGVTVKNIGNGIVSGASNFTYGPPVAITAINNNVQRAEGPFVPVTIFGTGFQAPVAVDLAGWAANVVSVSATEIVVIPGVPVLTACTDITGVVTVTNINSGDTATSTVGFTYSVTPFAPVLNTASPSSGDASTGALVITLSGQFLSGTNRVTIAGRSAAFTVVNDNTLSVTVPNDFGTAPVCTTGNPPGTLQKVEDADIVVTSSIGCTATLAKGFTYMLPCTVPPTPTP